MPRSCSILGKVVLLGQPASPIPAMLQRLWHRNKCGTSWGGAATSKVLAIDSPAFRARHVTITCIARGHHVSGRYPNVATARLTVDFLRDPISAEMLSTILEWPSLARVWSSSAAGTAVGRVVPACRRRAERKKKLKQYTRGASPWGQVGSRPGQMLMSPS